MRLIDADKLYERIYELKRFFEEDEWCAGFDRGIAEALEALKESPILLSEVVGAEPVRHAQWIHTASSCNPFCEVLRCSHCSSEDETGCCYNYCPHCGAKMDGEIHE